MAVGGGLIILQVIKMMVILIVTACIFVILVIFHFLLKVSHIVILKRLDLREAYKFFLYCAVLDG